MEGCGDEEVGCGDGEAGWGRRELKTDVVTIRPVPVSEPPDPTSSSSSSRNWGCLVEKTRTLFIGVIHRIQSALPRHSKNIAFIRCESNLHQIPEVGSNRSALFSFSVLSSKTLDASRNRRTQLEFAGCSSKSEVQRSWTASQVTNRRSQRCWTGFFDTCRVDLYLTVNFSDLILFIVFNLPINSVKAIADSLLPHSDVCCSRGHCWLPETLHVFRLSHKGETLHRFSSSVPMGVARELVAAFSFTGKDRVGIYFDAHTNKKDEFEDPANEEHYISVYWLNILNELCRKFEEETQLLASSSSSQTCVNEAAVFEKVLGPRRERIRGIGIKPPIMYTSSQYCEGHPRTFQ
ncbi:hypothetical protein LXL04_022069 [Taraxacum kok-saghyz]